MADTIALMRKRVLDMAIRGELVEQRPEEGTGKELYRDIEQEKDQLMKSGKIKKEKNFPLVSKKEEPFEIPINWTWVRLGSLTAAEDDSFSDGPFGSNLKTIHYTENPEVRIIQLNNVGEGIWKDKGRKYTTYQHAAVLKRYNIKPGDMVIAKMMPAGRTIIIPEVEDRYIVSSDNVKFVPNKKVNSTYIMHTVNSSTIRQMIVNTSTGTTRVRTSSSKLKNLFVPLPPLAEQNRIVAKIEEIFAVIDQISERKGEALSIIRNMRQTALQEAIMGVLVEQDEMDESAYFLYEKIQAKNEQLVKEQKLKKDKSFPEINAEEVPFEIPESWKWVKMGSLAKKVHYGYTASATENGNVKMLRITDIQGGRVNWDSVPYCEIEENIIEQYKLNDNDIVIARTGGTVGKSFKINKDTTTDSVFASYLIRIVLTESDSANYIAYFLNSPYYWEQIGINAQGTGQPNVNATQLSNLILPLPPLAEQERIVEKLNEIMGICDQMESILNENSEVNIALKVAE